MTFEIDADGTENLTIKVDAEDKDRIRTCLAEADESGQGTDWAEAEFLEPYLCNSEYTWATPLECGALTDAPIIATRDEDGAVADAWGFMDYQLRSFLTDLLEKGEAVFLRG